MQWLHSVINLLMALIALGALYFTRKTFELNKLAKRSVLAPTPELGHCIVGNDNKFKRILFSITNYGLNPAYKVRGKIHCYDKKSIINDEKYLQLPFWGMDCYQSNPLSNQGEWKLKFLCESPITVDYIIFMVSYMDVALNKRFTDIFYWKVENEQLTEVSAGTYKKLVKVTEYVEKNQHDLSSVPKLYGEEI